MCRTCNVSFTGVKDTVIKKQLCLWTCVEMCLSVSEPGAHLETRQYNGITAGRSKKKKENKKRKPKID